MERYWLMQLLVHILLTARCTVAAEEVRMSVAFQSLQEVLDDIRGHVQELRNANKDLSRQVMLQQFFMEEKIRGDGDSGVKLIRNNKLGLRNYFANSHVGNSFMSIHDHSNLRDTMGLGEISVVMNGVEFRTRHNDYRLKMPSYTSTEYHETEPLPYPDVPPAVLAKNTVQEQIDELRLWFKAFVDQDDSVRDYKQYFTSALCYMEGAWTLDKDLAEPFASDRHQLDASSWFDLQEKVRFASYSGTKSRLENYAFLPTTIMSVDSDSGVSNYAQWNYRILCHPTGRNIPFSFLQQVDDAKYRVRRGVRLDDTKETRAARFRLFEGNGQEKYQVLDDIMSRIPGMDNGNANLTQGSFADGIFMDPSIGGPLNTANYHRSYKTSVAGAMGTTFVFRGYNDENCWVAQTTQNRVAPASYEQCKWDKVNGKRTYVCERLYSRFTYAIPLELVYLTPLLTWNPYNVGVYEGKGIAAEGGRNGGNSLEKAFNGTDRSVHYLTPIEFFQGSTDTSDPADTVKNSVHVLDQENNIRKMAASGTRIILQEIQDVGKVRLRYPIAPVHGEGSSVWKELNALKDEVTGDPNGRTTTVYFEMAITTKDPPGEHTHELSISMEDYENMAFNGTSIENVVTSQGQGHTHTLTIRRTPGKNTFEYTKCGTSVKCGDGHPTQLTLTTVNIYTALN